MSETNPEISKFIETHRERVSKAAQAIAALVAEFDDQFNEALGEIVERAVELASDLEEARADGQEADEDARYARDDRSAALDLVERLAEIAHRYEPAEVEYLLHRFAADGCEALDLFTSSLRSGSQVRQKQQLLALVKNVEQNS